MPLVKKPDDGGSVRVWLEIDGERDVVLTDGDARIKFIWLYGAGVKRMPLIFDNPLVLEARLPLVDGDNGFSLLELHPDDPAMRKIAELEARVKELEAPTVAPELTDEQCRELRCVLEEATGFNADRVRAMIAAYEKMRRPITDEAVERADEYGR